MPGKRNPKYQPIGSEDRRPTSVAPLEVRVKKFCRQNKPLLFAGACVFVAMTAMWFFGRSRAAGSFAASQGLEFSSSADYKLPKKLAAFETLSRGTKQYAFNVMKGELPSDGPGTASVQGFDFSYTESKVHAAKKGVSRTDKVHELTALMFSRAGMGIKSLLVSPRNMLLETDEHTPVPRADPDVEDVMTKDEPLKSDDEDDDKEVTPGAQEIAAEAAEPEPAKPAEEAAVEEEELDPVSDKFNSTFVVEAVDVNQTAAVLSPGLKKLLLSQPGFFVDFQDDRFLVFKEFTFEPQDYQAGLELGQQILAELNRELPRPTEGVDMSAAPAVFVSRSKMADDP